MKPTRAERKWLQAEYAHVDRLIFDVDTWSRTAEGQAAIAKVINDAWRPDLAMFEPVTYWCGGDDR